MTRAISEIIDDLIANVRELKDAVGPITRLVEAFKGADSASSVKTAKRGPGRPRKAPAEVKAPAAPAVPAAPKAPKAPKAAKSPKASGKKDPARQLQGKYMAAVKGLPKAEKAEAKKVRAEKGIEEALKFALGERG